MMKIKKGDIVSRISYNHDVLFYVVKIANTEDNEKIAILKGVNVRVEADAPISDLEIPSEKIINRALNEIDTLIECRYGEKINSSGKILHLDGDKKYSEKTQKYYKQRGLNYIVKHVAEYKQPYVISTLLTNIRPDILVITGHDGMIRRGKNFNDINNYRNSKYFVRAVREARTYSPSKSDLVIFAGACQSYYEALISAGANFASSPARILIDFVDPLIVAENVAVTNSNKIILMSDLEHKIRNGRKAISGIGAKGKSL